MEKERAVIADSMVMNHAYDKMGGVKLKIVAPSDFADTFSYKYVRGSVESHLANIGTYYIGTAIQAPIFVLEENIDCSVESDEWVV